MPGFEDSWGGRNCRSEQVAGLFGLGVEIGAVVLVAFKSMGHAFGHGDAMGGKGGHLVRVVGHQADRGVAEQGEHAGGDTIEPLIGLEAEALIGLYRVETLILKPVGPELVDEPDAAPLLRQIEQDAAARRRNGVDGAAQLLPAIAFEGAEQIAGETFRMQPGEDRALVEGAPITMA